MSADDFEAVEENMQKTEKEVVKSTTHTAVISRGDKIDKR